MRIDLTDLWPKIDQSNGPGKLVVLTRPGDRCDGLVKWF